MGPLAGVGHAVRYLAAAVGLTLGFSGCAQLLSPEQPTATSTHSLEVGSGATERGDWYATWEAAAVAEAARLHPDLTGLRAQRVHVAGVVHRMAVVADGGFCALYGGMSLEGKWRANEWDPSCGGHHP